MSDDILQALKDEYLELEQSEENKRRRNMWKGLSKTGRDQYRPMALSDRSWQKGKLPITVDVMNPTWAKMLGFDINQYYFDAKTFVSNYLKIMIHRFKNFPDDTFLPRWLPMWGTTCFEASLFGIKPVMFSDKDPWMEHTPIINRIEDIETIPAIDFRKTGLMPALIKAYEESVELAGDEFEVLFPEWIRSPFGVAVYLRGFEDLLVDMLTDEEFFHALMRFITDARKNWFRDLEKYLGKPVEKANMFNDEISTPTLSPEMYRDHVFAYEQELCDFHGGLHYWHSCGDVSAIAPEIAKLGSIDLFNNGAWTSVLEAGRAFRDKAPLEVCMNPQKDILEGTEQSMTERVLQVVRDGLEADVAGFGMKISALSVLENIDDALDKIHLWIRVARRISEKLPNL